METRRQEKVETPKEGRWETCDEQAAALIGVFVAWLMCALKCISRFFVSAGTLPPEDLLTEGILPQIVFQGGFSDGPDRMFFFSSFATHPSACLSLSLALSIPSILLMLSSASSQPHSPHSLPSGAVSGVGKLWPGDHLWPVNLIKLSPPNSKK